MPEYEIFIPAFTFAHLLGLSLLLYSLEKVSGVVSKTWNRISGRIRNGGRTDDADQLDRKSSAEGPERNPAVELEVAGHKARTAAWRRGCNCEVGPFAPPGVLPALSRLAAVARTGAETKGDRDMRPGTLSRGPACAACMSFSTA
jgi:hypothetical protein